MSGILHPLYPLFSGLFPLGRERRDATDAPTPRGVPLPVDTAVGDEEAADAAFWSTVVPGVRMIDLGQRLPLAGMAAASQKPKPRRPKPKPTRPRATPTRPMSRRKKRTP